MDYNKDKNVQRYKVRERGRERKGEEEHKVTECILYSNRIERIE